MASLDAKRPAPKGAPVSSRGHGRGWRATGLGFQLASEKNGRLWKMLIASAVVHALLSPAPALLGLVGMLPALQLPEQQPPEERLDAIPVNLVGREPAAEKKERDDPPEPQPEPPEPEPSGKESPRPKEAILEPKEPVAEPKESPEPANQEEVSGGGIGDPVALAGPAGKLADSNANVRLLIYPDLIRNHPLGPKIGNLLKRTPQWQDFFGPSGVNPVTDVDRVLIAGPQLRDSSNVVAVIAHDLSSEAIDTALSRLVQRDGRWLRRDPPLAQARADRATRLFSAPRPGIVAVAPPSASASLRELGKELRFPEGPEGVALQAYVVRPARPVAALGLQIPSSIEWLRVEALPLDSGGARLRLLLQDESPEAARKHASELQALLRKVAEIDLSRLGALGAFASLALGGSKKKMVQRIDLFAEDDQIRGLVEMTEAQLVTLSDLLDAVLPPPRGRTGAAQAPSDDQDAPKREDLKADSEGRSQPEDDDGAADAAERSGPKDADREADKEESSRPKDADEDADKTTASGQSPGSSEQERTSPEDETSSDREQPPRQDEVERSE